jgi:hypothetical protein
VSGSTAGGAGGDENFEYLSLFVLIEMLEISELVSQGCLYNDLNFERAVEITIPGSRRAMSAEVLAYLWFS